MAEIYKVDASFDHGFFKGTSCAFGVFDGVHRGHRYLLDCARSTAAETGGASVALTFDIDPDEVFHPTRLKKLMTNEERVRLLADSGVDVTVPSCLHVGYDFKFGARAAGTVRDLDSWAAVGGTSVQAHDLKSDDGAPITATRIRLLLAGGDVEEANRLLGRPYFMTGVVEPGRGEGADMGFRTANLVVPDQMRPLGDGVYAAYAHVDGVRYKAAVNVGVAATFADRATATCEVHLLDFSGDLYGKPVKVEFLYWLRPMRKFDDLDELIATVKGNIAWVRENL